MKVIVVKDAQEGAKVGAEIIEKVVRENPNGTIGLATGSSPIPMYKELARKCKEEGLDFSGIHSVNLDEYIGLDGKHDQSYRFFMDSNLFDHINIDKKNTFVPNGIGDIDKNLAEFNKVMDESDVLVQVLGIGPDGHIAFNEPHEKLYDKAHVEVLDQSTIDANSRFFASKDMVPKQAFTQGMGNIMRARKLLMIVSGNKDDAMKKVLIDEMIDPMCPATYLRMHRDATIIIEKALADRIGYKG